MPKRGTTVRRASGVAVLAALLLGSPLAAQDPEKRPPSGGTGEEKTGTENQGEKEKEKEKGTEVESKTPPPDPPLDEAEAAARALRKLLGPKTRVVQPDEKEALKELAPARITGQDPAPPSRSTESESTSPPVRPGQDPRPLPTPAKPPTLDEPEAAAEALRRLIPRAQPVTRRPEATDPPPDPPRDHALGPPEFVPGTPAFAVDGSLRTRFRGRWTSGDRDADLLGVLQIDAGDSAYHPVTAHLLARANWDLGGTESRNAFRSIEDARRSDLTGRLYQAHVDLHLWDDLEVARIGRQTNLDTPEVVVFDGVRLESAKLGAMRFWGGAYGGVPTHLFESSSDGDYLVGLSTGIAPWAGGRARVDWTHVQDRTTTDTRRDHLVAVSAWQNFESGVELHGSYSWLDGDDRDARLRVRSDLESLDLQLQASYYELMTRQFSNTLEFDPFSTSAFEFEPYRQIDARADLGLSEHLRLAAGFDLRRLRDRNDEAKFNREFERYYVTFSAQDLVEEHVSLDVTAETWDSSGEDVFAIDASLHFAVTRDFEADFGTSYWLYHFDLLNNREQERTRVYFADFDYRISDSIRFSLGYAFEHGEFEDYHVAQGAWVWQL